MVFSDQIFVFFFLPLALICILLSTKMRKGRNLAVAILSLIFLIWGSGPTILVFLFNVIVNYAFAIGIDKLRRRWVLLLGIACNLIPLFYYKYAGFTARSLDNILPNHLVETASAIALPIGISFYTFQGISYLIDVWRKEVLSERSLLRYTAYHAFFPQVIAGPIVRYKDVADDFARFQLSSDLFASGALRFVIGLLKKVVFADTLGTIANASFDAPKGTLGMADAWIGALAYSGQIYFDFSGYSDMAIGIAMMCGIRFLENFNHPYSASTISDFWRRWHISLSTWFRDYLYIPLGGNRNGSGQTYLNLAFVFLATGIWHGAEWTFIFWGLWHGLFLIIERFLLGTRAHHIRSQYPRVLYALPIVVLGWVLFRSKDLDQFFNYARAMVDFRTMGNDLLPDMALAISGRHGLISLIAVGLILAQGAYTPAGVWAARVPTTAKDAWVRVIAFASCACLALIAVVPQHFSPFLYFRF